MILPGDLRLRIAAVAFVIVLLSPVSGAGPALGYLVFALAVVLSAGRPMPWRRLLHLEVFLLLLLVTLPFTLPGTRLFSLGPLTASREGLARAGVLALKVSGSALLLIACFADVEPARLGQALRGLGLPEPLVRIFLGLVRYLGVIRGEFARLQEAMRMRAFRPRSNRHTWRSYGNMMGMLLLRSMARAERVEEAMRMRGYAGRFPGEAAAPAPARDWYLAGGLVTLALVFLIWDLA